MFRKLIKNKKAQSAAEYAILIALVVAGISAMQVYAQRALQARVRDASHYLKTQTSNLGNTVQYEPYYLQSDYTIERDTYEADFLGNRVGQEENSTRTRKADGYQSSDYSDITNDTDVFLNEEE